MKDQTFFPPVDLRSLIVVENLLDLLIDDVSVEEQRRRSTWPRLLLPLLSLLYCLE
jgi:hypothetical protein